MSTRSSSPSISTTGYTPGSFYPELWADLAAASHHLTLVEQRNSPISLSPQTVSSRASDLSGKHTSDPG